LNPRWRSGSAFSIRPTDVFSGHFQGRLHVSLRPATLRANGWSILVLTPTARGKPMVDGGGGVLRFLQLFIDRFGMANVLIALGVLVALIRLLLWVAVGILNRQK